MTEQAPIILVLGGARSGKSAYAQARAEAMGLEPVFVATAQAFDDEMATRIARHQADRDDRWRTVDAPLELPTAVTTHARSDRVLLLDCLTLWVSNLMMREADVEAASRDLCAALRAASGPIILVSNEVGLGIVPDNALARSFRDAAGRLNQMVAAAADEVLFMVAGLPMPVRRHGTAVDNRP